uniref:Max-binding protein MNT n=1 Tax=Amphilophus citrinellus TaxID=61819 RepID=A0A3Q0R039_AMPCI
MSIETLLEAAKFLEFQAQQQQKAREDELKEKLRLQHLKEQSHPDVNYNSTVHINNVSKAEVLHTEPRPPPVPSTLPPPSVPITVIPIPVVTPNLTGSPTLPVATLSPPAAPRLASPKGDSHSPLEQSAAALLCSPQPKLDTQTVVAANHTQPIQNHHNQPQLVAQTNNTKLHQQLVQRYPGSIVSSLQQQALLPHSGPVLQQAPLHNGPISRGSPPDDSRQLDSKKRPGGAGTREVQPVSLTVHRIFLKTLLSSSLMIRAHLKECFETLKKNIPNIDEKKTSNLSVLRSALRYIQTLKRKEKEYEHDMERLAREKIATQQRLEELKNELSQWMDVIEIDRILRQTVQPEEDQASTSTASGRWTGGIGGDLCSVLTVGQVPPSKPAAPPTLTATTSSTPTTPSQLSNPTPTQMVTTPSLHPTVIAHAPVSHPSVIQVIPSQGSKNIAQLAPSTTTSSVQLAPGHQPISHITVHPVAHLSQHLPTLYPQPVAVTQPAVVGHITQTINHAQVNGNAPAQPAATIVGKQTAVSTQMMAHHPQLVGQTVLNPVTMVTMPSFPISTLKLA